LIFSELSVATSGCFKEEENEEADEDELGDASNDNDENEFGSLVFNLIM
jgi:hypothetical protein